jgi:predicted alpha/beta superfamily hydrolase
MSLRDGLLLACLLLAGGAGADTPPTNIGCASTATGDLRIHTLDSRIFGNQRQIRVLLPPGYDAPENARRRYDVLYMLDGQNLFDACLSDVSHREWELDETVLRLEQAQRIPPMIVVGVDHAGPARAREYLPYKDFAGNPDMDEPEGRRFPDFMTNEVMPSVDSRYRTLSGHDHTGIGGSSYGGSAALYALLAKPGRFGYGLIESPVLTIGMGQLIRDTSPLVAMPRRVFVAFGAKEIDDLVISAKFIGLVHALEANFRSAGYDDSTLRVVIDPDGRHSEPDWARRLPDALAFLYGP